MDSKSYYENFKKEFDFIYKGIHLQKVVALTMIDISKHPNRNGGWRSLINLFKTFDCGRMDTDKPILSTFGQYRRKDHQELFYNVMSKLDDSKVSIYNTLDWKLKIVVHPLIIFKVLKYVFSMSNVKMSFSNKLRLIAMTVFYCNFVEELLKNDFTKVKKYVCQASMLDLENLMTQFFKLSGVKTYSLAEGIYYLQDDIVDSVQYTNFTSDILLVWGQYSVEEFTKYGIPSENLIAAGYPKEVKLTKMKVNNEYKKCMVLLARESYGKSNMALLDILSKYSNQYEFCLKLHPGSDFNFYKAYADKHDMTIIPREKTVDECLNNELFDFAIAVNTTAYYEALMRGVPCFRYQDDSFLLPLGYDDIIKTDSDFVNKLSAIQSLSVNDYQKEIDHILTYTVGIGIDKYKSKIERNE